MRKVLGLAIALVAASCAVPAMAQTVGTYTEDNGATKNNIGVVLNGNKSDGVLIDCVYNITPPTITSGQRADVQCDNRGRILNGPIVTAAPVNAATNTITAANTSQQVFAALTSRTYLFCQNPIGSATTLFVEIGTAASATGNAYELAPGGSFTITGPGTVFTGAVNVMSATAGARFICKQG